MRAVSPRFLVLSSFVCAVRKYTPDFLNGDSNYCTVRQSLSDSGLFSLVVWFRRFDMALSSIGCVTVYCPPNSGGDGSSSSSRYLKGKGLELMMTRMMMREGGW